MQFYKLKQYNPLLFMIIHLNFKNFFQIYWIEMEMICSKSFVNIILFLWMVLIYETITKICRKVIDIYLFQPVHISILTIIVKMI